MVICKQCGNEVEDESDYCERCGNLIEDLKDSSTLTENYSEENYSEENYSEESYSEEIIDNYELEEDRLVEQLDEITNTSTEVTTENPPGERLEEINEANPEYIIRQYRKCLIPIYGIIVLINMAKSKTNSSKILCGIMVENLFIVSIIVIVICVINYLLGDMVIRI